MLSVEQLSAVSGLRVGALVLGVSPSPRHRVILTSYLLNLWRGPGTVREMLVSDYCSAMDMGAPARAADILLVLRQFLDDFPEAGVGLPQQ